MKKILCLLSLCLLLTGCASQELPAQVAATTLPVYEFTVRLCEGTPITVTRLVTESVSCLHDYSLNVRQVKAAEAAETIIISGAGLEDFLDDVLLNADTIDASQGIELLCGEEEVEGDVEADGGVAESGLVAVELSADAVALDGWEGAEEVVVVGGEGDLAGGDGGQLVGEP